MSLKLLSRVRLFATPRTVAYQAPLSIGFSRQECWSGLPFPSPGDLPDPGIEPRSPALQTDALPSEPPGKPLHLNVESEKVKNSERVEQWLPGGGSRENGEMLVYKLLVIKGILSGDSDIQLGDCS